MVTVTGFTAERMLEIEDTTVIGGSVAGDNLLLEQRNGDTIDAGNVRGPIGPPGTGSIICTSTTRPSLTTGDAGTIIYETDTGYEYLWTGTVFRGRPVGLIQRKTRVAAHDNTSATWQTLITMDFTLAAARLIRFDAYVEFRQVTSAANPANYNRGRIIITGESISQEFCNQVLMPEDRTVFDTTHFNHPLAAGAHQALLQSIGSGSGALRTQAGSWFSVTDEGTVLSGAWA